MMSGAHSAAVMWSNAFRRAIETVRSRACYVCAEVNDSFDYRTLHSLLNITPDYWLPHFENAGMIQLLKRTLYQGSGKIGREYTKEIDNICEMLARKEDDCK